MKRDEIGQIQACKTPMETSTIPCTFFETSVGLRSCASYSRSCASYSQSCASYSQSCANLVIVKQIRFYPRSAAGSRCNGFVVVAQPFSPLKRITACFPPYLRMSAGYSCADSKKNRRIDIARFTGFTRAGFEGIAQPSRENLAQRRIIEPVPN